MRTLFIDIETAPTKAYVWGLWKQNIGINMIDTDWSMLSVAAKWADNKSVMAVGVGPDTSYEDDYIVVKAAWTLLDQADIVVAHNGDRFDIPKMNARFLYHDLPPPSTYKTIDTLKVARKQFKFTSNKLDYLAQHLGVGKKMATGGFELWQGCMDGDEDSWYKMIKYNKRDVKILEKVYMKMRAWIKPHPNVALYGDADNVYQCPTCGSTHVTPRGNYMTNTGRYTRYQCNDCDSWSRSRTHNQTAEKRKSLLTTVA